MICKPTVIGRIVMVAILRVTSETSSSLTFDLNMNLCRTELNIKPTGYTVASPSPVG